MHLSRRLGTRRARPHCLLQLQREHPAKPYQDSRFGCVTGQPHSLIRVVGSADAVGERSADYKPGLTTFAASGDGTPINLIDGIFPRTVYYATGGGGGRPSLYRPPLCEWPPTRHGADKDGTDGANYLLADGHVLWLGPDQVSTGSNARNPADGENGVTFGRAAEVESSEFLATFSLR